MTVRARKGAENGERALSGAVRRSLNLLPFRLSSLTFPTSLSSPHTVLTLAPADPDALAAQAYLLHEGERFAEALAALDAAGGPSPTANPALAFARAHALYSLGRVGEAGAALADLARAVGGDGALPAPARHLAAQVAYRQGRYGDAIAAYEALATSPAAKAEDADALAANVIAAYVSAGRGGDARRTLAKAGLGTGGASHEVEFNLACAALGAGDLEGAATARAHAEAAIGAEVEGGEDGALPAGLAADAVVIRSQAAYLAALSGKASPAESSAAYADLLASPALDGAARAVVANNAAAAATDAAPHAAGARRAAAQALHATDSLIDRSAPARLAPALESRLPSAPHARALLANRASLLCLAGKAGPAAAAAAEAAARFPGDAHLASVRAGVAARAPAGGATPGAAPGLAAALGMLAGVSGPEADAARAQLAAEAGDAAGALRSLDAWWAAAASAARGTSPSDSLPPALVATRVDLLVAAGDAAGAEAAVDAALASASAAGKGSGGSGWRAGVGSGHAASTRASSWLLARKARLRLAAGDLDGAISAWSDLRAVAQAAAAAGDEPGAVGASSAAAELMGPLAAAAAAAGSAAADGGLADLVAGLPAVAAPTGEALDRLEAAPPGAARSRRRRASGGAVPAPKKGAKEAAATAAAPLPGATEASAAVLLSSSRTRAKRRRSPRYPAGVDPAHPGPPPPKEAQAEKWLPKWARADAVRAKKRRGGGGAPAQKAVGSQGAGQVDSSLDSAARPTAVAAAPPAQQRKKKGRK